MSSKKHVSYRQRLRDIIRPSSQDSALPQLSTRPQLDSQPDSSSPSLLPDTFLERALVPLSDSDRCTLRKHILSSSTDINHALSDALVAAEQKQQHCQDKRWNLNIRGRQITLQEQASKVVHWLNRFKAVGDVVANVDPVHAGLPWAGICLLLEVAVAEENQMRSLLVGLETALYMADRLKAYIEFFQRLPASAARDQFQKALTRLYTHILQFLAQAIQIYQTSGLLRVVRAFGTDNDILKFEEECDKLASRAEIEASNCDRILDLQDRQTLQRLEQYLHEIASQHGRHSSPTWASLEAVLDRLPVAERAEFDAYEGGHDTCHPETRLDVLRQVHEWASEPNSKHIFWLNGAAGTGKSTISRTVAERLSDDGQLAASFFFKRNEGDRGSAARFVSTIARQLVTKLPQLIDPVSEVLRLEPNICTKILREQFDKLIYEPARRLKAANDCQTLVVVVDALDECEKPDDVRSILQMWARLPQITTVPLRLFITGRPELPILLGFNAMSKSVHQDMILQDVPRVVVERDIEIYLHDAFSHIRHEYNTMSLLGTSLDGDWPGEQMIRKLVSRAFPLFVVAATMKRFIGDPNEDPEERLDKILSLPGLGHISQMQFMYLPVLKYLSSASLTDNDRTRLYQDFHTIVGSIIVLAEPLPIPSLSSLLQVSPMRVESRLRPLYSVLQIPRDAITPVRTLHLSFTEFLLDETFNQEPYHINSSATHKMLLARCLDLLSGENGLHENLAGREHPGELRQEIPQAAVKRHLAPELQYACQHWVYHAQQSMIDVRDGDQIHNFLQSHFIHWLESLSLIGRTPVVVDLIAKLQNTVSPSHGTEILTFLDDARRFVFSHRYVTDLAPLQLYSSVMIFSPQTSVVRNSHGKLPTWIHKAPVVSQEWSAEVQRLEGHARDVRAVSFSSSGQLASGSWDGTVRIWNISTGQEEQRLDGHNTKIKAIAFSPDGRLLATGSWTDSTVRVWEVSTGQEIQQLHGHTEVVSTVAFSPQGQLASGSTDRTVRLWDTNVGQEVQKLTGCCEEVSAVAFSPAGQLTSGSWDGRIQVWDVRTGQEVQELVGHTDVVTTISFSPDGRFIASGSEDQTVRLWDTNTGQELQRYISWSSMIAFSPNSQLMALACWSYWAVQIWDVNTRQTVQELKGHTDQVHAVAFSSDGQFLASGSNDNTVRLWDVKLRQGVPGNIGMVNMVTFSPDGQLLASASWDNMVRVWDVSTGRAVRQLKGHTQGASAVTFSPNGQLLASASYDQTVRLWDAGTGQELRTLAGHMEGIRMVIFSPDGRRLASASWDTTVRIWEISTGQVVQKLEGHDSGVIAVAFSPDGQLLASTSYDETVRLWNADTGQQMQQSRLPGATKLTFSDDGTYLLTDQGAIAVDQELVLNPVTLPHSPSHAPAQHGGISIENDWIRHNGQRLLWLPHEYRGDRSAVYGDVIAMGQVSGHVGFMQLDISQLPPPSSESLGRPDV